jgi:THO complex subunit 2
LTFNSGSSLLISCSNGSSKPSSSVGEVEDGEIDDATKAGRDRITDNPEIHVDRATRPSENPSSRSGTPVPESRSTATKTSEVNGSANSASEEGSKLPDRSNASTGRSTPTPSNRSDRRSNAQLLPPPPSSQHALPSRPEGEIPTWSQHPGQRQTTGHHYNQGRSDHPRDARDNYRGAQDSSAPRSRNRTPDPIPPSRHSGRDSTRDQPRDARDSYDRSRLPPRETRGRNEPPPRDRGYDLSQGPEPRGRPSGPPSQGTSESGQPSNAREPPATQDRTRLQQLSPHPPSDRQERLDRPIQDREMGRRYDDERQDRSGRGGRQRSPRRSEDIPPSGHPRSDNRQHHDQPDDRYPYDSRAPPEHRERSREEGANYTPSGPRTERISRHDAAEGNRAPKELFQQSSNQRGSYEPSHGRLGNADFSAPSRPPPQDISYGRLNPMPDAPAGPRSRQAAGRGGRNFSGAQPPSSRSTEFSGGVNQIPISPTAERTSFPGGQSQDWRDNRISGPRQSSGGAPSTAPPSDQAQGGSGSGSGGDTGGIHPSRLAQIQPNKENSQGQSPQTSNAHLPPAGPRMGGQGRHNTATFNQSQPPPPRNAPSGPASTSDRRDGRHLANLNSHLQQADRGGPAPRGRGGHRGYNSSGPPNAPAPSSQGNNSQGPPSQPSSNPNSSHPSSQAGHPSEPPSTSRQDMPPPDRGPRPSSGYQDSEHHDSRPSTRRRDSRQRASGSRSPSRRDRDDALQPPRQSDRPDDRGPPPPPPSSSRSDRPPREDHRSERDRRGGGGAAPDQAGGFSQGGQQQQQGSGPQQQQAGSRDSSRRVTRSGPGPRDERDQDREPPRRESRGRGEPRGQAGPPSSSSTTSQGPLPQIARDDGGPPPPPPPQSQQQGQQQQQWSGDSRGGNTRGGGAPLTPSSARNGERGPRDSRERRDDGRQDRRDGSGRDSGRKRGRGGTGGEENVGTSGEMKRPRRGEN